MSKMYHSSGDMLALVAEINFRRLPSVYGMKAKRNGGHLELSQEQIAWMKTARRLHHRYLNKKDYRHQRTELDQIKDLMWDLVRQHAENYNQPEPGPEKFSFDPAQMVLDKGQKLPSGSYQALAQRLPEISK